MVDAKQETHTKTEKLDSRSDTESSLNEQEVIKSKLECINIWLAAQILLNITNKAHT